MILRRCLQIAFVLLFSVGGYVYAQPPALPAPTMLSVSVDPTNNDLTINWKDTIPTGVGLSHHQIYKLNYPILTTPPLSTPVGPIAPWPVVSITLPLATGTMVNFDSQGFGITATNIPPPAYSPSKFQEYHFTMHLTSSIDTCTMRTTLRWRRYKTTNDMLKEQLAIQQEFNSKIDYEVWGYQAATTASPFNVTFAVPVSGRMKDTIFVAPTQNAGDKYFYFIKAYLPNGEISTSNRNDVIITGNAVPTFIDMQRIEANDGTTDLIFYISPLSDLTDYTIERTSNLSSGFTEIHQFNNKLITTFTDPDVNTAIPQYYRVTARKCGQIVKISDTINTIVAKCDPGKTSVQVDWSSYIKPGTYSVIRTVPDNITTATGITGLGYNDNVIPLIQLAHDQFCYRVQGITSMGITSVSTQCCSVVTPNVNMPDAIDPTQTTTNPTTGRQRNQFGPIIDMMDAGYGYKLTILNRWGVKVFETTKDVGMPLTNDHLWDGTFNGKIVEPGVYLYTLSVSFGSSQITEKGSVTIVY